MRNPTTSFVHADTSDSTRSDAGGVPATTARSRAETSRKFAIFAMSHDLANHILVRQVFVPPMRTLVATL